LATIESIDNEDDNNDNNNETATRREQKFNYLLETIRGIEIKKGKQQHVQHQDSQLQQQQQQQQQQQPLKVKTGRVVKEGERGDAVLLKADPSIPVPQLEQQQRDQDNSNSNKYNEILECLNGEPVRNDNNNNTVSVNLWKLRELALTRRGLLSPDLRQRAWPLLFATTTASRQQ
jgi:hypothetical protein